MHTAPKLIWMQVQDHTWIHTSWRDTYHEKAPIRSVAVQICELKNELFSNKFSNFELLKYTAIYILIISQHKHPRHWEMKGKETQVQVGNQGRM